MNTGFSIHEMENVARSLGPLDLGDEIGIEVSSPGDSLGLSMLANPGRGSGSGSASGSSQVKQITIDTSASMFGGNGGGGGGSNSGPGLTEIEIGGMETLEPITLNLGGGRSSLNGPSAPVEIQFSKASDFSDLGANSNGLFSNSQSASGPTSNLSPAPAPRLTAEEERKEKTELINKLQRLEAKGLPVSRKYTMDNTLEEIKQEYARLVDARNLEASIRFQRQMLMSVTTGLEWVNGRFDPLDLKLDGWSESVHENVEDFDEIFEELYDKYKERGKMPPEARLIMALAGSGFMCHVSNTFLRSRMPSMDDVLKQNPEIARQFAQAAAKQAGPGFGNFMSMAMGGQQQPQPAPPQNPAGAFFGSSAQQGPPMAQMPQHVAAMEPRQTARREMKGPSGSGVDDILRTFEEVRRNEDLDGTPLSAPMMNSENQPAVNAAMEMQSMGTDDIGSTTESRMGGGRGRRRRPATVTGNTLSLNV